MQPYQQQYGNPLFGQQPMFGTQQTAFQPMSAPAYMPQALFGNNYQSACRWCTQPFGVCPPLFSANDRRAFHNGKMFPEKTAHQTSPLQYGAMRGQYILAAMQAQGVSGQQQALIPQQQAALFTQQQAVMFPNPQAALLQQQLQSAQALQSAQVIRKTSVPEDMLVRDLKHLSPQERLEANQAIHAF